MDKHSSRSNNKPFSHSSNSPSPQTKKHIHRTEHVEIQVQDDRTGMGLETLRRALLDNLYYVQGKDRAWAMPHDYYMALAYTVRDRLLHRWLKTVDQTYFQKEIKVVCYLSAEYLIGRQLGKNMISVGMYESARQVVQELGFDLYDLLEQENEPGLGNGGLGRLAACFLDSLSTLEIPAIGYGIRYEFGIFQQAIREGWQIEQPDRWLRFGNPWEIPRPEYNVEVPLGGHTETYIGEQGQYRVRWIPEQTVLGTPYDTPISGYNSNTVNTLRLWSAKASQEFNFQIFNAGDYNRAVADKTFSENITKVLYPNDNIQEGKLLRLEQQYFFVTCSLQDIIRNYLNYYDSFDTFPEKIAIQINDTHPSIGIAELMRLLVDIHQVSWDRAWEITHQTFGFTNHTVLAEALERWPVSLFRQLLPRHLEIIYEINRRFLNRVHVLYPGDEERIEQLSIVEEGAEQHIRMAHLACVGSHSINGVAKLHSDLLKHDLFRDFYAVFPEKFNNKTNGVTPRRWILLSNPKLALLITDAIGKGWITNLDELKRLEPLVSDRQFCKQWQQVKQENKHDLAEYILETTGVRVDAHSLFDVQVKRIHEYKRQHLNVLHVITLYNRIKQNPSGDWVPRTVIFSGKAAPGYVMAKLMIKLINSIAEVVNHDPDIGDRLKVVFLPNYSVSVGQRIFPAADLSEQISTAGKEASGTGNMKFAMNGALTIGTLDGANIEIREQVGAENFFLFGLNFTEVAEVTFSGYEPWKYYTTNPELKQAIAQLASGYFSHGDTEIFQPLVQSLKQSDEYLVFADYQSYIDCQEQVSQAYRNSDHWIQMSILNVARMGYFSSDRAVWEYAREIWKVEPAPVMIDAQQEPSDFKMRDQVTRV